MAISNVIITDTGSSYLFEFISDAVFATATPLSLTAGVGAVPVPPAGTTSQGTVSAGVSGLTQCQVDLPKNPPHTDLPFYYLLTYVYIDGSLFTELASGIEVDPLAVLLSSGYSGVPLHLDVVGNTPNEMHLSWSGVTNINQVSGYNVYRSFIPIGSTTGVNYIDSGLNINQDYFYRLTTVFGTGTLNSLLNYNPDFIPQTIVVGPDTTSSINISWGAPTSGVSGYRVYRSEKYNNTFEPVTTLTGLNYIDSGLDQTKSYYYSVTSIY